MEELYRSLYAKYATGLSEDELDSKVQYALQQDPSEFINAFYQKYTGAGPSESQVNYMNSYLSQKSQEPKDDLIDEDGEPGWIQKLFGRKQEVTAETEGEYFDFLINPGSFTKKDKERLVQLKDSYSQLGPSEAMKGYQTDYENNLKQYGDDPSTFQEMWAGLKAIGNNVGAIPEIAADSFFRPVRVMYGSEEAEKLIGGVSAARGGFAKGGLKGKLGKGMQTAWAISQGSGDAALQLHQLLVEELGQDYTADDLEKLMEDEDRFMQMRRSAAVKGMGTAITDYAFMNLSLGAGKKINRVLANTKVGQKMGRVGRGALAVGGAMQVEGFGGATAEGVGQFASNISEGDSISDAAKKIDGSELVLEYFAEQFFGGVTGTAGLAKSGKYTINGNEHTESDFRAMVDGMTDEQLAQITYEIEGDVGTKQLIDERRNDGVIKNNLDTRVTDEGDRAKLFDLEKELQALENTPEKSRTQSKTNQIADKKKQIKEITNSYFERSSELEQAKKATSEAQVKQVLGQDIAEAMGGTAEILSQEEVRNKYGDEAGNSAGFEMDGKVILNRDVALNNGMLNVAAHEFIHQALRGRLSNKDTQAKTIKAIEKFQQRMSETNPDIHAMILDNYAKGNYKPEQYQGANIDEYLGQLADLMRNDKSIVRKIQGKNKIQAFIDDVRNLISEALGIPKAELNFETADDVVNFMVAHNKAFTNRKADKRFRKFTSEKVFTTGEKKFSKVTIPDGNPKEYVDSLTKNAKTKAEFQSPDGGFGQVYEGILNGDFDKLLTGFTTEQKNKAREELANRLINYDPALTPSLYKWFGSNIVYSKREANKALAIEAETKKKTKSIDQAKANQEGDTFATQIEDKTELTPEEKTDLSLQKAKPKKEKPTLRRKLGFERNGTVHNEIKDAIKRNILRNIVVDRKATKKDVEAGLAKKKGEVITETLDITDLRWQKEIGRALGLDLQSLMMKRMGRSEEDFTSFLNDHIVEAFKMMDQNLINNRYGDLVVKVVDRQGSQQSALNKRVKSKTAGNALFEKRNKTKEELVEYFLKRGRKNSLAQVLGTEFGFDALVEVLLEPDMLTKAEEALVNKNGLKGDALVALIAKQVNRDSSIKFSKVLSLDEKQQFLAKSDVLFETLKGFNRTPTAKVIAQALKQVFPNWDQASIDTFSRELHNPVKRYMDKIDLTKNVDFSTATLEAINLAQDDINLRKLYGIKESFSILSNNKSERNLQRDAQAEYVLSFKNLTGKAKVDKVKKLLLHKSHNTGAGTKLESMIKRYQVYQGVKDFNDNTINLLPGVEVKGTKVFVDGKQIETIKTPSQNANTTSKADFESQYKDRQKAADLAFEELNEYIAWLHKNTSKKVTAMSLMTLKSHMGSMLKTAAPAEFYFEGKHKGKLRYEHMLPTEFVVMTLAKYHSGVDTSVTPAEVQAKYKVAIIPEVMDKNIDVFNRQSRLSSFDFKNDNIDVVYYNAATWGYPNMFPIKSLSGKGEVIGEAWASFDDSYNTKKDLDRLVVKDKIVRKYSKLIPDESKGMSIFDFDDTLARSNSKVGVTMPDGTTMKINATEFAQQSADLEAAGAEFNFDEFNKVIDGKKGPFFDLATQINSKFGNKNIYILTARPQEAAYAIHTFLKGIGLNVPINNIVGLEDGRASAKADWVANKVAEGYNNILFADDAIKNVKAVKEVLDFADVKSDVRQAKIKFSKTLDENFNTILEKKSGIKKETEFSKAAARAAGQNKNKFKFFIPPSAEDFVGLLYQFLPKGKAGDMSMKFFKQALIDPYWAGIRSLNASKQAIQNDFRELKKRFPNAFKALTKDAGYKGFTNEMAIRTYLWNKAGFDIPGMSKSDEIALVNLVKSKPNMRGFADMVGATSKMDQGYIKPGESWTAGSIAFDFFEIAQKENRKKYLAIWKQRKDEIFSEKNMNKIEAIYGSDFKNALEDILWRMENGTNRRSGNNKLVNQFQNWVNNSVGAIMFFNARSAVLQTISMINFINWSDNNPLKAGMAFANQPQFWADFSMIFNSDMLKQRRAGLQSDVNEAEIAQAVAGKKDKASAAIAYLLQKGFLPTQMADSFAISMGGATFYRNRFNTYKKQGLTDVQAKEKAFADFQQTSEVAQQSADPALISGQQAGPLGRLILAFQNTPMQYARLIKKSVLDLKNGRGDVKTNISKILYYGAIQNIIFSSLQSALFAGLFDDDEEMLDSKKARALNTSIDSLLRGMGIAGASVSTIKNMILQFNKQSEKEYRADYAYVAIDAVNLSPPIGSKVRKLYSAMQTYKFNRKIIPQMGMDIDNPAFLAVANVISAATNIPTDRVIMKINNLRASADANNETWQRIAMFMGWNTWDVGVKNPQVEALKKANKKTNKKTKTKYRK